VEVVDFIQQHQAEDRADPRDRTQPIARVGVVLLGRGAEGELHVAQPRVVVAHQREVDGDALWHGRIGDPRGAAVAVGLLGHLLANRGQMIRAVGLLDMGQSRGALAQKVDAAPEEITGRTQRRGIEVGLRDHAPTPEHRDCLGIKTVVFGVAAMDGFQVERVPADEGDPFPRAQVSQPIPREETFDRDDNIIPIGCNDLEAGRGGGVVVVVYQALPGTVYDTDVHRPGMPIDATVKLVLLGVEAPEVSSS
jgi:hypothetical protein